MPVLKRETIETLHVFSYLACGLLLFPAVLWGKIHPVAAFLPEAVSMAALAVTFVWIDVLNSRERK